MELPVVLVIIELCFKEIQRVIDANQMRLESINYTTSVYKDLRIELCTVCLYKEYQELDNLLPTLIS